MTHANYVDITLEIDKASSTLSRPRTVHLRRGETGTTIIRASVEKDGQPFPVDGMTASFCAVMPGTLTVIDDTCDTFGNVVEYEVPGIILNCSGKTDLAYLSFSEYDEGGVERVLTTQAFSISVNPGVDITDQEYQSWTPRINRIIEEAAASIRGAVTAAQRAEADLAEYQAGAQEARAACVAAAERAEGGEDERTAAEDERRSAEAARAEAEEARAASEAARIEVEATREVAEEERAAAEEDREVAEADRQDAEEYRRAKFSEMEQRSRGWLKYWCGEGEFDPDTRRPLIDEPDAGTLYHTPSAEQTEDSIWLEWEWDDLNGRWELHGTSTNSVKPITAEQMDAIVAGTDAGEGNEVLYRWGLRYWFSKMKGAFASLLHNHAAADITSGTFGADRIGTGAVTEAKLAASAVTTAKIANSAVTADKLGSSAVTQAKIATGAVGKDQLSGWIDQGPVSDIGQLYTCGRMGRVEIHCKKTAALAAWKSIYAGLPNGIKAAETSRACLACEDKPDYICSAVIEAGSGDLHIYNRSSSAWPASNGFFIVGQLIFPLA